LGGHPTLCENYQATTYPDRCSSCTAHIAK
jgi:hypothetical protein